MTPPSYEYGASSFVDEEVGGNMAGLDRKDSSNADMVVVTASLSGGISPLKSKPRVLRQRNGANNDALGGRDTISVSSNESFKGGELLPLMHLLEHQGNGRLRKESDFETEYATSLPASVDFSTKMGLGGNGNSSSNNNNSNNNNNFKTTYSTGIGRLRTKDDMVQHFLVELHMLGRDWAIVSIGTVMQWIHSVLTNIAYYYHTQLSAAQRVPLKDIAYELLPTLTGEWWMVSEYIIYTMLTIAIAAMASILVVRWHPPHGRPLYAVPILKRLMLTLTVCQILRCISFLCTTLPGASRQCLYSVPEDMTRDEMLYGYAPDRGNPEGWAPPMTVSDILWRVDATNGCGDLMFSSHTIFTMTFVCIIWRYFNWRLLRWSMLTMQLVIVPSILAAHKHYSVDVFTALYVTPLVFDYLCVKFPDQDMNSADLAAHYGIRFRLASTDEAGLLRKAVVMSYRRREYTVDIVDAPLDFQLAFHKSREKVEMNPGDVMIV